MKTLRISQDLSLPLETATRTQAILARKGGGKTYLAKVMAEEFWDAGIQFVVFDMVGVCWGLRSSADGQSVGLPILILGGDKGDKPLPYTSGAAVAAFIVDSKASVVLDFSHMTMGQRKTFVTDFSLELYRLNKEPIHLIVDEADVFAPQRPMPDETRMLHAMSQLVLRGRAKGIGMTCLTQRPARLNKDILTQCEVLVLKRLMGPQDIAAVKDWIGTHSDREETADLIKSLPGLKPEEGWFWSPGEFCKLVTIREARTFDSSQTPKIGQVRREPKTMAEIDMSALDAALTVVEEEATANDPKALRKRVKELEEQLAKGSAPDPEIENRLSEAIRRADRAEFVIAESVEIVQELFKCQQQTTGHFERLLALFQGAAESAERKPPRGIPEGGAPVLANPIKPTPRPVAVPSGVVTVSGPQQRMLNALASFAVIGVSELSKGNLAVFSDQSPKSSGYRANLSALSSSGFIEYRSGNIAITKDGHMIAETSAAPTTLADLHRAWKAKLTQPQGRMLTKLIELYPDGIHRSALASATNQSISSSGYRANLSKLSGLGLLKYNGPEVHATAMLFPEGLK